MLVPSGAPAGRISCMSPAERVMYVPSAAPRSRVVQLYLRDAAYGGQGLAAEAQRAYGLQAALVRELACGVAQEGHAGVLRRHAAAVVRDADKLRAAGAELHGYIPGPGVYGVFHQLLDRRGGPLDHLARGDEVRDVGREYVYPGHGVTS